MMITGNQRLSNSPQFCLSMTRWVKLIRSNYHDFQSINMYPDHCSAN